MSRCPIRSAATSILLAAALNPGGIAHAQEKPRELSGTVIDSQHEPLANAVVKVQDDKTNQILSFITDRAGHYDFKRLQGGEDYHFWATYRGHRSRKRHISMFDSQTSNRVTLIIRLQ